MAFDFNSLSTTPLSQKERLTIGTTTPQNSGAFNFDELSKTPLFEEEKVKSNGLVDKLGQRFENVKSAWSPKTEEQKSRAYFGKSIGGTLGEAGGAIMDVAGSMIESTLEKTKGTGPKEVQDFLDRPFGSQQLFARGTKAGDFETKINDSLKNWASTMLGGAEYGWEVSKEQYPKGSELAKDVFNATGLLGTGTLMKGAFQDVKTTKNIIADAIRSTPEKEVAKYTEAVSNIAKDYQKTLPLTPTQQMKEGARLDKTGDNVYTTLAKNGIEVGSGNEITQLDEISDMYRQATQMAQKNEQSLFSLNRILKDAEKQIDESITSAAARIQAKAKVNAEIQALLSEKGNKSLVFIDANGEAYIKSALVERLRQTGNSWTPFNAADPEKIGMSTGYSLSNAVRNEVEAFGTFPAYREVNRAWGQIIHATETLRNIERSGKAFKQVGGLSGSVARRVLSGALGYHLGGVGGAVLSEIGSEYAARILSNPALRTYLDRKIVSSALSKNPTPKEIAKLSDEVEKYVYEQTLRSESGLLLPEPAMRMPAPKQPEYKMEVTNAKIGQPYQVPKGQQGAGQMRRSYTSESASPQSKTLSQNKATAAPSSKNPTNAISKTVQRDRDLRKPDKMIVAKKNIKKTPEIKKIEAKIAENVRSQKAAIKAKDYTLVAKLKKAYDVLVAELKKAIKYLNENGSVGMSIKKSVTPESVAKRADDADMGVLDYVIRDYDNAILDPNVNRTLSDMGLGKATREERIRFAKEVFDEQAGVASRSVVEPKADTSGGFEGKTYYHTTSKEAAESIRKEGFKAQVGDRTRGVSAGKGIFLYEDIAPTKEFSKNITWAGKTPEVVETTIQGKIFNSKSQSKSINALAEDLKLIERLKSEGYVGIRGTENEIPVTFVFDEKALKPSTPNPLYTEARGKSLEEFVNSPRFEYHLSSEKNLKSGDVVTTNNPEGVYTSKNPDAWKVQLDYERGKTAPQQLYLVEVANPSDKTINLLQNGKIVKTHESISKVGEVKVISKLGTADMPMEEVKRLSQSQLIDIWNKANRKASATDK